MTVRRDDQRPDGRAGPAGPAGPGRGAAAAGEAGREVPGAGEAGQAVAGPGNAAPAAGSAGPGLLGLAGPAQPAGEPAIAVQDELRRRVRRPVDLLRCIADGIQLVLVAGIGLAARAATTGTEQDIVGASRRLPGPLLAIAHPLAPIALLVLPAALAVRQIVRRQPWQLAEAIGTGLLAAVAVGIANVLLRTSSGQVLYDAITMARPGVSDLPPLTPALAGLAAYTTIIGLSGRPRWRAAVWITIGTYSLVSLVSAQTTVIALAITLLAGRAIGLGVRYAAGYRSRRPPATAIAAALGRPAAASTRCGGCRAIASGPAITRRLCRTAASWISRSSTGTSRRPACCTGFTVRCGCRRRCRARRCCRWTG